MMPKQRKLNEQKATCTKNVYGPVFLIPMKITFDLQQHNVEHQTQSSAISCIFVWPTGSFHFLLVLLALNAIYCQPLLSSICFTPQLERIIAM